jgi:hypothetical protein
MMQQHTRRVTLTGAFLGKLKGRQWSFRVEEGYETTVELPEAIDERLYRASVLNADGTVQFHGVLQQLRVRGQAQMDPDTGRIVKLVVEDFELVKEEQDPNALGEALFERLAQQDPNRLLRMLNSGDLEPALLTHAAETAGRHLASELVVPVLLKLLQHTSPLVREGAIYGLSHHDGDQIDQALQNLEI